MPLTGEYIKASDIPAVRLVPKTASQSVTSSITLVDDTDVTIDLEVGLWRVELFAHCSSPAVGDAADIRSAWAFDGTTGTVARSCMGPGPVSTNNAGDTQVTASGIMRFTAHVFTSAVQFGITDDATSVVHEDLYIEVTAAGTLQWQWAQGSSSGSSTTVSAATRMYVTALTPA